MINEAEHRLQKVKVGFSWTLLFWTWLFAIPLFLRRVHTWAFGVLGFILASYYVESFYRFNEPVIHFHMENKGVMHIAYYFSFLNDWGSIALFILSVYLGFKGNEITGRHYLRSGWRFAMPDSPEAKYACYKWHIPFDKN